MSKLRGSLTRRFLSDDSGLTTYEYLTALGLTTAAVLLATVALGDGLSGVWVAWADFVSPDSGNLSAPPA